MNRSEVYESTKNVDNNNRVSLLGVDVSESSDESSESNRSGIRVRGYSRQNIDNDSNIRRSLSFQLRRLHELYSSPEAGDRSNEEFNNIYIIEEHPSFTKYTGEHVDVLEYDDQCIIVDRSLTATMTGEIVGPEGRVPYANDSGGSGSDENLNNVIDDVTYASPLLWRRRKTSNKSAAVAVYPDMDTALFNIEKKKRALTAR